MRRKLRIRAVIVFFLAAVIVAAGVLLQSCVPGVSDFAVGAMKTNYEVDEALSLEGAKIKVIYVNGRSVYVNVTEEMVSGFDTSLSGKKTFQVTYRGVQRNVDYVVGGNIKTKTRLAFERGSGAECVILLRNVEFPVSAITFFVSGDVSDIPAVLQPLANGWKIKMGEQNNGITVLLYNDNGSPITEETTILNFLYPTEKTFEVSAAAVSESTDGNALVYELPAAKLNSVE